MWKMKRSDAVKLVKQLISLYELCNKLNASVEVKYTEERDYKKTVNDLIKQYKIKAWEIK